MTREKRIPVLPGAIILLLLGSRALSWFVPGAVLLGLMGSLVGALLALVWWLFFSRRPWLERIGAIVLMAIAIAATKPLLHVSVAGAGMGMMFYILGIPVLSLAFLVWALAARGASSGARWASMIATIVLACGVWTLFRTGGITGDGRSDFAWRWSETPEERLLAREGDERAALTPPPPPPAEAEVRERTEPTPPPAAPAEEKPPEEPPSPTAPGVPDLVTTTREPDWPGFRGPARDSVISDLRVETDWSQSPPVELWRRRIGPGWSSFAVAGDLLYTQEQRGEDEIVACYEARTGEPVWMHRDPVRFYESNGGPGPRGTPTLHNGRVYAFGATGILNVLDAEDGSLVWSRDVRSDSEKDIPGWGFSSSPLVVGDLTIVAASGKLVAYDLATGEPRWLGPDRAGSYSSPHLVTIDGIEQVVLMNGTGITGVKPVDGTVLWEHPWPGVRIVQPAVISDGDLLVSVASAAGGESTRRISVAHEPGGWNVEELWTSNRLKPYFNDFVVHDGHAYGFDGRILACIDLEKGERQWKGGRYGHGQLVLLRDQDLLLVVSEEGELALVEADPDQFTELARFKAIEGKTWNHPALVRDLLLVRNGEEMAAFRLPSRRAEGDEGS